MTRAADLLGELLDRSGAKRELREHRIPARWSSIVGPRVAGRTIPDGLDDGVLWVRVTNSAWLHELSFLRADIVTGINKALGAPLLVKEVRFHLGARRNAPPTDALAPTVAIRRPAPAARPLPEPASGERLRTIERETSTVGDEELRAAILEARRLLDL